MTKQTERQLIYKVYGAMKHRCYNKNSRDYMNYGARGIKVCERWLASFANFLEDMGPRPIGASLERIDNSRGYEPNNCKWATKHEQQANRRSSRKTLSCIYRKRKTYMVQININGSKQYFGCCDDVELAKHIRDDVISQVYA